MIYSSKPDTDIVAPHSGTCCNHLCVKLQHMQHPSPFHLLKQDGTPHWRNEVKEKGVLRAFLSFHFSPPPNRRKKPIFVTRYLYSTRYALVVVYSFLLPWTTGLPAAAVMLINTWSLFCEWRARAQPHTKSKCMGYVLALSTTTVL